MARDDGAVEEKWRPWEAVMRRMTEAEVRDAFRREARVREVLQRRLTDEIGWRRTAEVIESAAR